MSDIKTVLDPFTGADAQISNRLVDRLRGLYAVGPHLPNGNPEFGWRQFQAPPIQHEAAERIEALEERVAELEAAIAAEREACAQIAEVMQDGAIDAQEMDCTERARHCFIGQEEAAQEIAASIRARSTPSDDERL